MILEPNKLHICTRFLWRKKRFFFIFILFFNIYVDIGTLKKKSTPCVDAWKCALQHMRGYELLLNESCYAET